MQHAFQILQFGQLKTYVLLVKVHSGNSLTPSRIQAKCVVFARVVFAAAHGFADSRQIFHQRGHLLFHERDRFRPLTTELH